MNNSDNRYKSRLFWILQAIGWSLYGVIDSYLKFMDGGTSFKFILGSLITYSTGIIISLFLRIIYRRFDVSDHSIFYLFLIIFGISLPAGICWIVFDHLFSIPLWGYEIIVRTVSNISGTEFLSAVFYYSTILIAWSSLYFGIKNTLEWQISKDKIEKTKLLLEVSQLKMLRYQLNPHFLFNSLSSLRGLIREDRAAAEKMLSRISEFLRFSLVNRKNEEVPLQEELESIRSYSDIEKVRFGDKLEVTYDIDPLAEDFPVPALILYPLVENAIKYGMDTSSMPLKIIISAEVDRGSLKISVINSGKWIEDNDGKTGTGTGINNIKKRLGHLYPEEHYFGFKKENDRVIAEIELKRDLEKESWL